MTLETVALVTALASLLAMGLLQLHLSRKRRDRDDDER
jgi:hypothetical protein